MEKKYKVLKKFDEFKKGEVIDLAEVNLSEEEVLELVEAGKIEIMEAEEDSQSNDEENEGDVQKTKEITKVTFVLHNRNVKEGQSTRVFDQATHGADFIKVANEFASSNQSLIISRADE